MMNLEKSRPILHRSDIQEYLNKPPDWTKRVISLEKPSKYVVQNTISDCHSVSEEFYIRTRFDNRCTPKTLVCHDYKGGYHSDSYVPFEGTEDQPVDTDGYTFYNWSQIDYFIYFSHHFITIPPLAWLNAGHKNGVKVLGTLITENADFCHQEFLKSSEDMMEFVEQLVDIQTVFKFDGWLLNIENTVKNPTLLCEFVELFTKRSHEQNGESVILWYDSVTKEGELLWQNKLNSFNKCFFDSCDGIFLNYSWKDEDLVKSVEFAGARRTDVFVGVDIFGRNMFGGGKFETYKAVEVARKYGLSVALFAPGWTHELNTNSEESTKFSSYLNRDDAFWLSLWPFLYTHPKNQPFNTNFHIGLDFNNYNLYIQKPQTSRLLHPNSTAEIPNFAAISTINPCACLSRSFFQDRNAIAISTRNLQESTPKEYTHRLFTCDIRLDGKIGVYYVTKKVNRIDSTTLDLCLLGRLKSGSVRKILLSSLHKAEPSDNLSLIEVNKATNQEIDRMELFNEITLTYSGNNPLYTGMIELNIFEFTINSMDLLEIGAIIRAGTIINLLEFGLYNLKVNTK